MPLFATYGGGGAVELALNVRDLRRGDELVLMDGTETVASGSASVHYSAGPDPHGGGVMNDSFYVQGCGNGTTWTIQGSNGPSTADTPGSPTSTLNTFAATFQDITTPDPITGNGAYTDQGSAIWKRFKIVILAGGDNPVVIVRRS